VLKNHSGHEETYTYLTLQLWDSGNKQIKKIPISHRTLLAFRDKLDRDVEQG
jgi:hypothetical protein